MSFPWTIKYPLSAFSCSFPPKASKPADHKTATMKRNLFALIWAPATICKKVKKNTTYSVGRFHTYPAGEFFTFYFKLPRFHQLLAVYIITLKRVIWLPRREATAALPLIFWTPSVTAAAYSHRKARKLLETKLSDGTGLDWQNGRDKLPPPAYIYVYLILPCCNSA